MNFRPFLALFGLLAFSPLSAQTTQAYQLTLSINDDPYAVDSFTFVSNPDFTGLATASYDQNSGANVWTWSNNPASLENAIFNFTAGISGTYTSIYYEAFTINSHGFLTYSVTATGLSAGGQSVTALGWGVNLQTFTFPTEALSLSAFLSTLTGNQIALGHVNVLLGNGTSYSPPVANLSVQPVTVPEPSAIALVGGAGALLLWARRSYRRN